MLVHFSYFKDYPIYKKAISDNQAARDAVAVINSQPADYVVKRFDAELLELINSTNVPVCVLEDEMDIGLAVSNGSDHGIILYLSPDRVTNVDAIVTLKHELVHVKQYADGRLKVINDVVYWEGEQYTPIDIPKWSPINDIGRLQYIFEFLRYYNQPWEAEAQSGLWALKPHDLIFSIGTMLMAKHGRVWHPDMPAKLETLTEEDAAKILNGYMIK